MYALDPFTEQGDRGPEEGLGLTAATGTACHPTEPAWQQSPTRALSVFSA